MQRGERTIADHREGYERTAVASLRVQLRLRVTWVPSACVVKDVVACESFFMYGTWYVFVGCLSLLSLSFYRCLSPRSCVSLKGSRFCF